MPDLVLLHGFTQSGASWERVRARLPARYTAHAPDVRGHGDAAHARPISFELVVADVLAAAPEQFTLGGYSMGGRLALLVALAAPERVQRLVLIGATAGLSDATERRERAAADEALAAGLERDGLGAFAASWAALPLWAGLAADLAAEAQAIRLAQDAAGLAAALRGLGTGVMPSLWERLGSLPMDVVAAAGERDGAYVALAERIAAAVPRGRVVRLRGAGHAAYLEAPGRVAELLAEDLR
jgi:2-succinyl-6-hydroxy-2,4-cyclohexadiene-1-carboxylate synthase